MEENIDIFLSTYPRSGSNYLVDYLRHGCGFSVDHTHSNVVGISIARNPVDSISSRIAMETTLKSYPAELTESFVNYTIENYENMYEFAINNNLIIDYDSLIKDVRSVTRYIADIYGKRFNEDFNGNELHNTKKFLRTSTKTENYNNIVNILKEKDLRNCNNLFNEALSKAYKIS